jgi:hypothetical protein
MEQGHGNAMYENLENPDKDATNHQGSTESLSLRPQASTQTTAANRTSRRTRKDAAGRRTWSKQDNVEIVYCFIKLMNVMIWRNPNGDKNYFKHIPNVIQGTS